MVGLIFFGFLRIVEDYLALVEVLAEHRAVGVVGAQSARLVFATAFFELAVGSTLEVASAHRDAAVLADGVGALGVAVLAGTSGLVGVGRLMSTLVGLAVLVEETLLPVAAVGLAVLSSVFLERLIVLLEWFIPFLEGRAFLSEVLADAVEAGVVLFLVGTLFVEFAALLSEVVVPAAE